MKRLTKQRGFGLIEIVLALGIISLALATYIPWQAKQEQRKVGLDYAAYVSRVIRGVQEYQYWQINRDPNISAFDAFPGHLRDLMKNNGQWWADCSENDYKQKKCLIPDEVPWNSGLRIRYNRVERNGDVPAFARITLPLGSIPVKERSYWKGPLIVLPYAKENHHGDIEIKIYDPMLSQFYKKAFESFIKKDGSTSLKNDWDVGNKAILNVSDITLRNSDGTLTSVAAGLTRKSFIARHGDFIRPPSCPSSMNPRIRLSALGNIPTRTANDFDNFGPMRIMAIVERGRWKIIAEYIATRKSDRQRVILRDGIVSGETYCSK